MSMSKSYRQKFVPVPDEPSDCRPTVVPEKAEKPEPKKPKTKGA